MHIDFKVTTWERIKFDELTSEEKENILSKLKSEDINDASELCNELGSKFQEVEQQIDYSTQMSLDENGGQSTIEFWNGSHLIYDNSYESEINRDD